MRKNSMKNMRINEEVHRELSNIIRSEIKDPRINPMTSVVAVEVAPDLKSAKAYISVLGDPRRIRLPGLPARKDISAGNWRRALICEIHRRSALSWISRSNMVSICPK